MTLPNDSCARSRFPVRRRTDLEFGLSTSGCDWFDFGTEDSDKQTNAFFDSPAN